MKILIVCFTFILLQFKGVVVDKDSKETLTGVQIISDIDTTYTDFDGNFSLLFKNNYINSIKFISYENIEHQSIIRNDTIFLKKMK